MPPLARRCSTRSARQRKRSVADSTARAFSSQLAFDPATRHVALKVTMARSDHRSEKLVLSQSCSLSVAPESEVDQEGVTRGLTVASPGQRGGAPPVRRGGVGFGRNRT